jgi:hypothetical protein
MPLLRSGGWWVAESATNGRYECLGNFHGDIFSLSHHNGRGFIRTIQRPPRLHERLYDA